MTPTQFIHFLECGEVQRYHATPGVPTQSLAEHQWGVAMIYLYLFDTDTRHVTGLPKALTHDAGERRTGDVPFPVKRENQELRSLLKSEERMYREALHVPPHWSEGYVAAALKAADYLEGMHYCFRCYRNGYRGALHPFYAFHEEVQIRLSQDKRDAEPQTLAWVLRAKDLAERLIHAIIAVHHETDIENVRSAP